MKNFFGKSFLTLLFLFCSLSLLAQNKKHSSSAKHTLPRFPQFTTTLGNQSSGSIALMDARRLLDSSLTVKDKKNIFYPVTEFDFGYQHIDTTFNDTTGMPSLVKEYYANSFHADKLDSLWRIRIGSMLQPGEKLFFDNIVAEDKKGKKYRTPPVHLIIQSSE